MRLKKYANTFSENDISIRFNKMILRIKITPSSMSSRDEVRFPYLDY
jgi:uncharacterized FlgJ-related protein